MKYIDLSDQPRSERERVPRVSFAKRIGKQLLVLLGTALVAASAQAASDVVISQVYGGGGNSGSVYKNDFIEIFNRGSSPVNVNGWSVQYSSATGTSWQVTPLPNLILQPGQYLLVQEAPGSGGSTALPTPDKIGSIALSSTAGKVALANVTTAITAANAPSVLDLVGFGSTANAFEGTGPTPAPSNTTAVLRAGNGCTDSDNNISDFATGAPLPRNSATTPLLCGVPINAPIVAVCPQNLTVNPGAGGNTTLTASDLDGTVNSAIINAGAINGVSLNNFIAATNVGASASVTLTVSSNLGAGTYPVTVAFGNDQAQTGSCTVNVLVQAPAPVTRTIPQIQGSGSTSPFVGSVQTTEGVVTLVMQEGFFMQDPVGDNDPSTSDGIYVFTHTVPGVVAGDRVRVTATVGEFNAGDAMRTVTELVNVSAAVVLDHGNLVTPTNIDLPLANANDMERYEGMLVRFVRPLTVTQNYFLGRYGQLTLSSGRPEAPTNHYRAGSADAISAAAANLANQIVLDDGSSVQNPNPVPYIGVDNTVRAGDTVSNLTGVVDFGLITSSNPGPTGYKIQPTQVPVFSRDNPREDAPVIAPGNVKVASFNVLNFFTTFVDGTTVDGQTHQGCSLGTSVSASNCRGANNLAEFIRQRDKIVAALKAIDADVFGLMEIQNNGEFTVSYLVNALNAAIGSNTYAVVPMPAADGSTGTDAIRVAMIYKPSKLVRYGVAVSDTDAVFERPPLAQTFIASNGEKFSVVVNHLKSKTGCPTGTGPDADQGDGQGCWNATRIQQAQRLANVFLPQVQTAANDPDILVIGDLNSYGAEDPIYTLTGLGLVSEIERFVRPVKAPYSYIFNGETGYIDHALATASLDRQVAGVTEWHINADEPAFLDYNLEFKPQDLYTPTPFRASDHDPVVISLNLQPSYVDVTNSVSISSSGLVFNRSTQLFTGTVIITNTSSTPIAAPLKLEFDNLTAGVTLSNASGTHAGAPYLSASATSLAPGQSVTVAVSFKNPAKTNVAYTAKVFSGTF